MAIIEVCDVCGQQVKEQNGITIQCSDMNGLVFIGTGTMPIRERRKYKVRICDRCVENIRSYCKKFSK